MNKENKKIHYLSEHGWSPKQYINNNVTTVIWRLQISDGVHREQSDLSLLEIKMLTYKGLTRHCEYIENRLRRSLERAKKNDLFTRKIYG